MEEFEALVVDRTGEEGGLIADVKRLGLADLPEGELLVRVAYSSLNYKDALACVPNGNIVKSYPFVPGIDLAGTVVESSDERFPVGSKLLVTGYGLGVSRFGGFGEYARVPADWAVGLPAGISLRDAMAFGTAGFTAALSVLALRDNGVVPGGGPVLVTGATGGVGSVAVAILAKLGYEVVASSGKPEAADALLRLGASRVIGREELIPEKPRPLDKQLWAGAVDCVGGRTLASALAATNYGGTVAASGMTGGTELPATVFPFILRGVRLIGIDSVQAPMETRERVWRLLACEWKPDGLSEAVSEIRLRDVPEALSSMLAGRSRGRVVVRIGG